MKTRWIALLLTFAITASGCSYFAYETAEPFIGGDPKSRDQVPPEDDTETDRKTPDEPVSPDTEVETDNDIPADPVSLHKLTDEEYDAYMAFTVRLLQGCADTDKTENYMVSPLSVMTALGMTAEGAKGETLSQMEQVLGLDRASLGAFLSAYLPSLPLGEGYKLTPANSIWMRGTDALQVKEDFLAACQRIYDAELYTEPFDQSTVGKINNWVSDKTDGMIDQILDEIPADVMLYLINALAFDSLWEDEYEEYQIRTATFTDLAGETREVDMMYSSEGVYLESDDGTGFVKFYRDEQYAFVGFLPREGLSPDDYLAELTGEELSTLLSSATYENVSVGLPTFTSEYSVLLNDVLYDMGITDLFSSAGCDLTDMATCDLGNIYVSRVLHKTFIDVSEEGTRAAAVTSVDVATESAPVDPPKRVILDRPFIYMILDWENRLPLFIGATETIAE